MAEQDLVALIGAVAGEIWTYLDENGPTSMGKLMKIVDEPRDVVMQAIGWLAREDKLEIALDGRTRLVSLRSQ